MIDRQGHGEGSITRRSGGTWRAALRIRAVGGTRTERVFSDPTRQAVVAKLRRALREQRRASGREGA